MISIRIFADTVKQAEDIAQDAILAAKRGLIPSECYYAGNGHYSLHNRDASEQGHTPDSDNGSGG